MTEDEIVELGDYCQQVMSDYRWKSILEQFETQIVHHMLTTEPHETKKREGIYAASRGVQDLLGHMATLVQQALTIKEPQEQKAASEFDPLPNEEID